MDSPDRRNLIIGIVVGLILGLLLGMALFWGLFPVNWTDAHSYDLAPEAKAEYMALVADSFRLDKDPIRAQQFLNAWEPEEKLQAMSDAIDEYDRQGRADKVQALQDLAMAQGITLTAEEPSALPTVEAPTTGIWNRLRLPCLVFVLVLLVLVLIIIGVRAFLNRRESDTGQVTGAQPAATGLRVQEPMGQDQVPLGRFFTSYQLGEDTYDESFSIESPTGEFLGECGMGISETIGDGEPDKVTAFEVWLFDKSDIRTVTKVLMSEYAFNDDAFRAKLAPKGEAVLAHPGTPITLETSSLQVHVDVTELVYGEGEFPPGSFFSRLVVELVAMAKPAESDAGVF
jgi:hypothetical protein